MIPTTLLVNGGMVLTNEGTTGVNWKSIESVLSGVGGSGVANYVARWSDEDTLTTGIIYDNAQKVGIWQQPIPTLSGVACLRWILLQEMSLLVESTSY